MNKHGNSRNHGKWKPPLPLYVVSAAADGDAEAMSALLKHYEGYIAALSMKWVTGGQGKQYRVLDEDKRQDITMRLIATILALKPTAAT